MSRVTLTAAAALTVMTVSLAVFVSVRAASPTKSPAPATINHTVQESALLSVTLTPQAAKRLGIETTAVKRESLARTRLYGGEIVAPPRTKNGELGTVYPSGAASSLYQLADARIAAAGRVELVAAQVKGAQIALARAERMLADESGSGRAVDDARVALSVAEADYRAAVARRDLLGVSGAEPAARMWVRMPVFAGDLSRIHPSAEARVGGFDDGDVSSFHPAKRVPAPRSADPTSGTVDYYYEVSTPSARFQPGQRVKVIVPLEASAERLAVPWSAIVHDVNGATWVYERVAEQTYARRLVQVEAIIAGLAALRSGPAVGAHVVTTGAAELFGTEFGVPH